MAQVVEHLPSKLKVLSSIPSIAKKEVLICATIWMIPESITWAGGMAQVVEHLLSTKKKKILH
jgi:hypothetical protein